MKTILVEEHFLSPGYIANGPGRVNAENAKKGGDRALADFFRSSDIGTKRIAEMDQAGIDMTTLLLSSPGMEQLDEQEALALCHEVNEFAAEAVKKYPQRFIGVAVLPTAVPDRAVQELELMVNKHNFKGALINGHIKDKYLSDKSFWPILEAAEKLNVPIYLHPVQPVKAIREVYFDGFSPQVSNTLAGSGWGWHIETAVHVLRIIMSGAFDKYPKLQIIIGHLGEGLPFLLQRIERRLPQTVTGLQRPTTDYLRENLYFSFGGWYFPAPFMNLYCEIGGDRILAAADYPHGSMAGAKPFIESLPISKVDKEKISYRNAERLFNL